MDRQEKIARLVERMKVTEQEAAEALDAAGGDLLDAALRLQQSHPEEETVVNTHSTAAQAVQAAPYREEAEDAGKIDGGEIVSAVLSGLFTHPILNGVEVYYKGRRFAAIPALALVGMVLWAFWALAGLTAVSLCTGCHIAFSGPQWNNGQLNTAWTRLEATVSQWCAANLRPKVGK